MSTPLPPWAVKVLVAAAVPGIACIGLYGIDFSRDASGWRAVLSIVAYPVLLIALIGLYRSLSARRRHRVACWTWGVVATAGAVTMVLARS